MRTTQVKWGVTVFLAVLIAGLGGTLRAEQPETFEPGTGKYIVVLKDPRTEGDDPATGKKKAKEPDVAKHGGKVLKKKDAVRIVKLPNKAAKALRKEENVAYVQRVWLGESQDQWGEDELTSSLEAEAEPVLDTLETDLTWTTGQYLYDGSGNIKQIGSDIYRYDSAGRLIQAVVKGSTETYKYDAFGNLTEKAISGVPLVNQVDPSSNRLKGEVYDAAGNLTTRAGAPRYQYDSLSMMDSVAKPGIAQTNRMIYGPDDERMAVLVQEGTLSRWKFRDFSGKVLREFKADDSFGVWEWTEDYVNGEGKVLAAERESYFGGKRHFHTDHLGTVRMITDQSRMRLSVHDFYPFGVEQTDATQEYNRLAGTYGSGDFRSEPMKFTGHERDWHGWLNVDNDDYLDYMHARYYDPNLGRFLSVDPGKDWDMHQPQSWNMYSYARNNPISNIDEDGRVVKKYFVRLVTGVWRRVERGIAVRYGRSTRQHAVRVEGPGASRASRKVVKDAHPHQRVDRHDAHEGGPPSGSDKHEPHWQALDEKKGSQVGYDVVMGIIGMIPVIGTALDAEAANADDETNYGGRYEARAQELYGKSSSELTQEERNEVANDLKERPEPKPKKKKDPKDERDRS